MDQQDLGQFRADWIAEMSQEQGNSLSNNVLNVHLPANVEPLNTPNEAINAYISASVQNVAKA